jgi:ubiquinone/menaquinone biosynthesis C-methylase UbiE
MKSQPAAYRRVYDQAASRRYQNRRPGKHRAEMRLLERAFKHIPRNHRVLDAPCGGGRVTIHLSGLGYPVAAADVSPAMIDIARENLARHGLSCPVELQDVESLTYPDRSFDTIVCFRLFHHFPEDEIRQRVVRELCRVAARNVVLSYFSVASLNAFKMRMRIARGERPARYHQSSIQIQNYFAPHGFHLVEDLARTPILHTLHLAVFQRRDNRPPPDATIDQPKAAAM